MLQSYLKADCIEVGVDEAGRGCLAGDVYAAAVVLPDGFSNELLNDSKQLTEKQREQLREVIERELHTLTPREEMVIKLRFGLEDGRPRTLEEVGRQFQITRERIRQIEAKALRKLRHPSRSKKLRDFLD